MIDSSQFPNLLKASTPQELRQLDVEVLEAVCGELRSYLIESVAETGGHLGASLGTVELTVALHYVFDTPHDRLVWDVGHQSYPHKILTGRRDRMHTMRMKDGLAGFNKRDESEYDTFGVGHSSTSISAALGMAIAAKHKGEDRNCVAVIGDGAMTAGMAFEAMNNAGAWKANMLVVLNDNDMSISPNVGALNQYFTRIISGKTYYNARETGKKVLSKMPPVWEFARRWEEHAKGMVAPGTLFEELGFNYYGPIDGHDIGAMVKILQNLKAMPGPLLLHVVTKKGKGYPFAEQESLALHAVEPFDPTTGKSLKTSNGPGKPKYTQIFSDWLCDMAAVDDRLVAITPAMREGSGLVEFEKQFPDRYFDVGIAEQHSVTLAAGLACEAVKPVVAIYSTFLQRGYDQLIHDVAIQNLPVLFALDRAGLVGPDGATHAGSFDYSYMRCLPNMIVMAPADENECRRMLSTGFLHDGPASVRYPRGSGPGVEVDATLEPIEIGKANVVRKGKRVALLAFGSMVYPAMACADELDATLINMRFVKPLDEALVVRLTATYDHIVTIEENTIAGGAGSAVNELLNQHGIEQRVTNIGLPDVFVEHGSREELLTQVGLDANGILRQVKAAIDSSLGLPLNTPVSA
ncbi:MAG: 1-deoxy-D-xylulose-5-phosphate synthase [Pseudomonadota bacterium]